MTKGGDREPLHRSYDNAMSTKNVEQILSAIVALAEDLPRAAARRAQLDDLGGDIPARDTYADVLRGARRAERALQKAKYLLRRFRDHEHIWNEAERCAVCGWDGRA